MPQCVTGGPVNGVHFLVSGAHIGLPVQDLPQVLALRARALVVQFPRNQSFELFPLDTHSSTLPCNHSRNSRRARTSRVSTESIGSPRTAAISA